VSLDEGSETRIRCASYEAEVSEVGKGETGIPASIIDGTGVTKKQSANLSGMVLCEKKTTLLRTYNVCVRRWSDSVKRLAFEAGSGDAQYLSLLTTVEAEKALTAKAKADYTEHVAEHGC
jgi:hypothetical protein